MYAGLYKQETEAKWRQAEEHQKALTEAWQNRDGDEEADEEKQINLSNYIRSCVDMILCIH